MTGKGIRGEADGRQVVIGNPAMLEDAGISLKSVEQQLEQLRAEGQTVMLLAVDGRLAGMLGVADPIKSTTQEAIGLLHAEGLQVIMLTEITESPPKPSPARS